MDINTICFRELSDGTYNAILVTDSGDLWLYRGLADDCQLPEACMVDCLECRSAAAALRHGYRWLGARG